MFSLKTPLMMAISVTNECNLRCQHCISESGKEKSNVLTFSEIINILDQAKEIDVKYMAFTGGEPFCRKNFIDILEYAKKL